MPENESVGINITVAYRLEKRRPTRELTEEELEILNEGGTIPGLEYELYETIVSEPEDAIITPEQLSFLVGEGAIVEDRREGTENGSDRRGT